MARMRTGKALGHVPCRMASPATRRAECDAEPQHSRGSWAKVGAAILGKRTRSTWGTETGRDALTDAGRGGHGQVLTGQTCHSIIISHPDTRETSGDKQRRIQDLGPRSGNRSRHQNPVTPYAPRNSQCPAEFTSRSPEQRKSTKKDEHVHPTRAVPLGRPSFELLSNDQPQD